MDRAKENELLMIASRWESICNLLDGEEVGDFMLSFPEVQQVQDLINLSKSVNETLDKKEDE